MRTILARWQDWSRRGIEHLILKETANQIVADAAVLGTINDQVFAVRYTIVCDAQWRVQRVQIAEIGTEPIAELVQNGVGNWFDRAGAHQPQLRDAIDIDISITPFTNTLPIRRLKLQKGQSQEVLAVYIRLPNIAISTDRQRYTCLDARGRYLYESVDSDFTREIEVDADGLVTNYPGLFRRLI
jgi:uncharacterized protein